MNKFEQNKYISNLQSTIDLVERSQALRLSYETLNNHEKNKNINKDFENNLNKQYHHENELLMREHSNETLNSSSNLNVINTTEKDFITNNNVNNSQECQINELKNLIEKQKQDNATIMEQNNYLMMENERLLNGERPLRKQIKNLANYLRDIRSLRDVDDIRYEQLQSKFYDNIEELLSTVDGSIYAFKGSFTGQDFPGLPLIKKKQIENIIDLLVGCFAHIRSAAERYPEDDILVFISLCVNICHSLSLCSCHINNLMKDINEGNKIINSLENDKNDIKKQLQSMIEMNEDLLQKYNNMIEKNKTLEDDNKILNEKYKKYLELFNENKSNTPKLNMLNKETQTSPNKENSNESDKININAYDELNKNYKTLNTKYQNSKKIITRIQKEFKKSTKLNILLNQKLKTYNEECSKLKEEKQNEIKKNSDYKLKIKELNNKNMEIIKALNKSNDSLKIKEKEEYENEIQKQNLHNESKNLKDELKLEIKNNMKQVDSLKKKILSYDIEISKYKEIIEKQNKDLMNLKSLLISKDKTIDDIQQKLNNNSNMISENIQNYNEKISVLTKENNDLKNKSRKIKEHKDFLEKTMIHWKKENESLRKKISKLSLDIIYSKDFQRNMDEFENKLKKLSLESEKKDNEQTELLEKVNTLESNNRNLKEIISKFNENEKQLEKRKNETINLINMYKAIKFNYNDNDKSEKNSMSSGSTIEVNDSLLFNEKTDGIYLLYILYIF